MSDRIPSRARWWALGAVLALSACGTARESGSNFTYQQASALRPGQTGVGTMKDAKDPHWWRVEVKSEGVLSAKVGGIRDIDFVLSAYDGQRRELMRVDETSVGGDERLIGLGVSPGTYYLVLSNKNPNANNPSEEYRLETTFEPARGRERRPNGSAAAAQTIEADGTVRGWFWPTRDLLAPDPAAPDEHWFAVPVDKAGLFLLNADVGPVPKIEPVLEVYDTNGYKLASADAGSVGAGLSLRDFGVRGPAKVYLRLYSKYPGAGNPDIPFDLMTELIPYQGGTEVEPNDQLSDATPFAGDSIQGTIFPAGDVDWYKVTVSTDAKFLLRAQLSGVPGLQLSLSLRDSTGRELTAASEPGSGRPQTLTGWGATQGDYYLVVSEKTGRKADQRDAYTLTKTLTPWQPGLEWEPNDSTATAQALKPGQSVDGYFAPRGDQDWYEFNLYQKATVELDLTGVTNVTPTVALFDQEYNPIALSSADAPGQGVQLTRALDPGTYDVRLMPADPAQNNVRDKYTFRVQAK